MEEKFSFVQLQTNNQEIHSFLSKNRILRYYLIYSFQYPGVLYSIDSYGAGSLYFDLEKIYCCKKIF